MEYLASQATGAESLPAVCWLSMDGHAGFACGRVTSTCAHSAEAWKSHVDGDKHEDRAGARGVSRNGWTVKKDGGKCVAHSLFNPS